MNALLVALLLPSGAILTIVSGCQVVVPFVLVVDPSPGPTCVAGSPEADDVTGVAPFVGAPPPPTRCSATLRSRLIVAGPPPSCQAQSAAPVPTKPTTTSTMGHQAPFVRGAEVQPRCVPKAVRTASGGSASLSYRACLNRSSMGCFPRMMQCVFSFDTCLEEAPRFG